MSKVTTVRYHQGKAIVSQRKNSFDNFDKEFDRVNKLNKILFSIASVVVITGIIITFALVAVQFFLAFKTVDYINTNGLESLVERIWEGSTAR